MRNLAMAGVFLALAACGDDGGETQDAADTRQDTTPADSVGETAADTAPAKVVWDDVYPIFEASCAPCHAGAVPDAGPSGGHSIASPDKLAAFAASQQTATIAKCNGKTIGECALIRIGDGSMPASGDCQDPKTEKCPTADEQALIRQWIDDGQLNHL